jgi:hypothetical protein
MATNKKHQLEVRFGAMCDPLAKQLKAGAWKFDADVVAALQRDHDAIVRLAVRGFLGTQFKERLQQKLFNNITAHVGKHN